MTSRSQPVRAPTGGKHGARKQLEAAQQARPLPDNRGLPAQGGGGAPAGGGAPVVDVYGDTDRPNEPATAGAALGAGPSNFEMLPPDPVSHIRALYDVAPNDDLRRLLERAAGMGLSSSGGGSPQPPPGPAPTPNDQPADTEAPPPVPSAPGAPPTTSPSPQDQSARIASGGV